MLQGVHDARICTQGLYFMRRYIISRKSFPCMCTTDSIARLSSEHWDKDTASVELTADNSLF
jgi:hypothetical protein